MTNTQSKKFTSVDEYFAGFPKDIQERLEQMRNAIKEAAPEAHEVIAYNMPAFKLTIGKKNHGLGYYAAYKGHIGFYPFPSGVAEFERITNKYKKSGKGSIQFPHTEPLPLDLIKKVIEYRVKEIMRNADGSVNPYMKSE